MENLSVNGKLKPTDGLVITDQYAGHFLKVSYSQEIAGHSVFSKDRVDVEGDGRFRFFVPKKELLVNELVTIEAFSPAGEMLGHQVYSHGALNAADISVGADDRSKPLVLDIDPKIIVFNEDAPAETASKKISGRVIDLAGERRSGGLQVLIMVSDDLDAEFDASTYQPIFSATTDANGYFFGSVENKTVQQAYGVIAGLENQPIPLSLEDKKIPKDILLVTDLSSLPDSLAGGGGTVPALPDSDELVNSTAFSQDIGGTCVDFTIPNRTLEEFSFYHTVRTTEPEIRGLTITSKESKKLKNELFELSDNAFGIVGRLNNSFNSLSLRSYTIEEEAIPAADVDMRRAGSSGMAKLVQPTFPNYLLKMDVGGAQRFNINTNDLIAVDTGLRYGDIVRIAAEQERKKEKLLELQQKLAAAYCGKNGVEEAKSYCEKLARENRLNREEIRSLIGHLETNRMLIKMDDATLKLYSETLLDLELLIGSTTVEGADIRAVSDTVKTLIHEVDTKTEESQPQENILGYLRRIVITLANGRATGIHFQPCEPRRRSETMGILCLIDKFADIKETLRNTTIFSLGEILEIQAYYTIFLESISAFIGLLDEFYTFYSAGTNFATELVDDYFYAQYDTIKSSLTALRRQILRSLNRVEELEKAYILNHPGRVNLSVENSIDWDETPTIYENTTIANGHILHFKQVWKADGYSLGDLLYSLPLAPCQEKQIAILDWDRQEEASRTEAQIVSEELEAEISRDRDISEIMNGSLAESIRASSSNSTSSTSAGIGGGIGGFISPIVFGVAGGISHSGASSQSSATQNSSRNVSASSLNRLQDNTSQSASSLRSQRSTVIQTVGQSETVTAQTEVIKNNNHCHAMTVEYFEVLKHYAIEQNLVDVQECLFVPMPMSHFDHQKVLRWKNTLRRTVYGRKLRRGFEAIERIESNYVNSDLPDGSYADEGIEEFSGYFTISFELDRPYISTIEEATKTETFDLSIPFPWFFGKMVFQLEREVPLTEAEKDAIFEEQYAPDIVRKFVDTMQIDALAGDGNEVMLELDVTLLSSYRRGVPLKVSIASKQLQNITRNQIKHLRFRANTDVKSSSKIILRSSYLSYRTRHLNEYIVRNSRVNNDIINSSILGLITVTDAALLYTPLNDREQRNPKKEDQDAASALVGFLNENMELAHKIIWSSIDASRLFGLLDGYIAPNSGNRSVASVVENRVMGVVGNNLVLKVIPGERLDPVFKGVENLLDYYQPTTAPDPYRISVPTKGVYAESVMGRCNSCEIIDESRHWRFSDEPCGTAPTPIDSLSTASRRTDPGDLQPKDLPANIINMQNAPAAPDPTGLGTAFDLLGKGDSFSDFTGLAATQANALGALQTTSQSVTDLASISKDFANLAVMANQAKDGSKQIEQIKKLNKDGYLSDDEANTQIKKVLDNYNDAAASVVGKGDGTETSLTNSPEIKEAISKASSSGSGSVDVSSSNPLGSESVSIVNDSRAALPRIIENPDLTPESRSFSPASSADPGGGSKTGETSFSVRVPEMPAGGSIRWSVPAAHGGDYTLKSGPTSVLGERVEVEGGIPGLSNIDVEVRDSSGTVVQSIKLPLSIPQFVTVEEDAAAFDAALTELGLTTLKNNIIETAKETCETLLVGVNVRTLWQLGPYAEATPAHIPLTSITRATIRNKDAASPLTMGSTGNPAGAVGNIVPNRTISVYPNAFDESLPGGGIDPTELDVETQALLIQLMDQGIGGDPALEAFASDVFGRLIGETLAHEIIHALLWDIIPPNGHNSPAIAQDLMNSGGSRDFSQRTGFVDNAHSSPVEVINFTDHGIGNIGGLQGDNQGRIDANFPVPGSRVTAFK